MNKEIYMFWGGGIVTNAMRKNKAELGGKNGGCPFSLKERLQWGSKLGVSEE